MDPSYQQMMIQQLMQSGSTPQGMGGQNATTPYGMGFQTGNMMTPNPAMLSPAGSGAQQPSSLYGMLGQSAPGAS